MKSFKISQSITDRKDESLRVYFGDISRQPLLSQEEETELARRIQKGDQQAESELIKSNLRFVVSVAKSYQGRGLDLVDLIQEGNCGIITAARRYSPDKDIKFISYAVWWIRQAIIKALLDKCRIVRVPLHRISDMTKINKISEKFEQETGRPPSLEEIEEKTSINKDKINIAQTSTYRSISIDSPLKDEDTSCLLDIIPNEEIKSTDQEAVTKDISSRMEKILSKLSYRNRDIIKMSFGIGMQAMSNDEIADRYGISGERVRQILQNALKGLKDKYSEELSELL